MLRRSPSALEPGRTFFRLLQILGVLLSEAIARQFTGHPLSEYLYRVVVRLGPTFIKLAQVASTRPDLVPADISARFKELQENVPTFPFESARRLIEADLGKPLAEAFVRFPIEPVAAASLAQVYFAELPGGTPVAVKVQRPGIRTLIERDLAILRWLARLASRFNRVARSLRLEVAVEEFGRWTLKELDFEFEGHNAEAFRRNFAGWNDVLFPKVYWSHSTPRVLTLQRVSGLRVGEVTEKVGPAHGRRLAKRLAELQMKMFIADGFFHADLHPGNIFFQPDGGMAILDLGMVGRLTPEQRDRFLAYWIAITRRQRDRAFHHLIRMAQTAEPADLEGFRDAYDINLDRFYDKELSERSLAQTYLEIIVSGARYGVVFPPEMLLQAKAVVTAEALDLVLAPDFRFTEEIRPIVARELAKRATPGRLLDRLWGNAAEWILLGEAAPAGDAPTDDLPDEKQFRRLAKTALADVWADVADDHLRQTQRELAKDAPAAYWAGHPERQALIQTALGLLRLLATSFQRLQQESAGETALAPVDQIPRSRNGHGPATSAADAPQSLRGAFIATDTDRHDADDSLSDELVKVLTHLEALAGRYPDVGFWTDRYQDKAAIQSALTLLRLLFGQIGQTARESLSPDTGGS